MNIINQPNQFAKKTLFILLLVFSLCCFKLCASDMSPAEAQVARETFVAEAKKYVGCPYELGAVGPDSFDCSGLVYYVARESIQKQLPRTAKALYSYCRVVPDSKKEVGDLLFFKTNNSGASVTHVGIYIGHNQFISAISDGSNTGVIISSLNQPYWKPKYVACGQFIKSGNRGDSLDDSDSDDDWEEEVVEADDSSVTSSAKSGFIDVDNLIFDATTCCDWSLFKPNSLMVNWRGIDLQSNVRYAKWPLQPGVGVNLRFNYGTRTFQMPVVISTTLNDYIRIYAGPVFTFGESKMPGNGEKIKSSIFPGTLGVTLATPAFKVSKAKVQIVQDISYNVVNRCDNSALDFGDSVCAGLLFSTGVRVSLGMKTIKGK